VTDTAVEPGTGVEVTVDGIASGGAGVARLPDGRVIFVHRTAPGDRARVEVTSLRKSWARGRLVKVLEPGPDRRDPLCPYYDRCGGCTLEHLTYEAQLREKGRMVVDALVRIGKRSDLPEPELHPSPRETRYRNRITVTLRRLRGRRVVAGFHELDAPDRILDVDGRCLLPEEPVARAWDGLRAAWGSAAERLPGGRELRLTLRAVEHEAVILLVEGGTGGGAAELILEEVPALRAIWAREEDEEPILLAGEAEVEESWYGERVPVRPGAFLQVNRDAAAHLQDLVLREAGAPRGRTIVDAYCGFGLYGRRLARHGGRTVGIEADAGAVAMAGSRPVEGFTLLEGRVEDRIGEALPADLVILNPPRSGVADGVMERIGAGGPAAAAGSDAENAPVGSDAEHAPAGEHAPPGDAAPQRVIYVSCDPATLARDGARRGEEYRIARLQVVDLFPQTAHVETVLTLDRVGSPARPPPPSD
jgi:23S rRNA (uracil1939-C5)-methyltransferase